MKSATHITPLVAALNRVDKAADESTPAEEVAYARLAASVYDRGGQPPSGVRVLYSGDVNHVQFDVYEDPETLYVVFAGSNQLKDWIRHCFVRKVPLPTRQQPAPSTFTPSHLPTFTPRRSRALVHRGWRKDAADVLPLIVLHLRRAYRLHGKRLVWIGHSYGGALAKQCAHAIACDWPNARQRIRTYGAPADGNAVYAADLDRRVPDHIRYCGRWDPVHRLPITYTHAGRLITLSTGWPAHPSGKYVAAVKRLQGI